MKKMENEAYESLIAGQVRTLYNVLAKANALPINVSVSVLRSRQRELTDSLWDIELPKQVRKSL